MKNEKTLSLLNLTKKEINENKTDDVNKNPCKKVLLFTMYINNRIKRLLKKSVCRNAQIVNDYYILNDLQPSFLNKFLSIDIKEWKHVDTEDINMMELCFKHKLEAELLAYDNFISFLNIDFSTLLKLSENDPKPISNDTLKNIYKQLEVINKRISNYYKVHGYLKELRVKYKNEKWEKKIKRDVKICQHISSTKHMIDDEKVKK